MVRRLTASGIEVDVGQSAKMYPAFVERAPGHDENSPRTYPYKLLRLLRAAFLIRLEVRRFDCSVILLFREADREKEPFNLVVGAVEKWKTRRVFQACIASIFSTAAKLS